MTARCLPATPGTGIVFRRVDLPGAPTILARLSEVQSTERRTVLGSGEAAVQTVEHLLAAAAALELDDLTIELDGPEPPIGDGSFSPYLEALEAAGVIEHPGDPVVYRVLAPFQLAEADSSYVVAPSSPSALRRPSSGVIPSSAANRGATISPPRRSAGSSRGRGPLDSSMKPRRCAPEA